MHFFHNGSAQVDAHGTLGLREFVELFALGHRGAAFPAGKDDGLHFFGDGELRPERRGGGLEGRDAGGDVVVHAVAVEEGHLFLDGAVDARIAGVETDHEQAAVVEFLHQGKLFFQIHRGGAANGASGLGVMRQFDRNEAAGVEDEIGLLQESLAAHRHQLRIARAGADDFDMAASDRGGFLGDGKREVATFGQLAFLLFDEERAAARASEGGGLRHAGAAGGGQGLFGRVRHVDGGEGFGGIDFGASPRPVGEQGLQERLVFLQFDSSDDGDGLRRKAGGAKPRINELGDPRRIALPPASEAQMEHRRPEGQHPQAFRRRRAASV